MQHELAIQNRLSDEQVAHIFNELAGVTVIYSGVIASPQSLAVKLMNAGIGAAFGWAICTIIAPQTPIQAMLTIGTLLAKSLVNPAEVFLSLKGTCIDRLQRARKAFLDDIKSEMDWRMAFVQERIDLMAQKEEF